MIPKNLDISGMSSLCIDANVYGKWVLGESSEAPPTLHLTYWLCDILDSLFKTLETPTRPHFVSIVSFLELGNISRNPQPIMLR